MVNFCNDEYGLLNFERHNYTLDWQPVPENISSVENNPDLQKVYAAFKYQEALSSGTYPVNGQYSTYYGGGYFFSMAQATIAELQSNLSVLQASNWIDRQTRAISFEAALYNANVGLFAYVQLLIELTPAGNILTDWSIAGLNLTDVRTNVATLNTLAMIFYLAFIMLFIVLELNKLRVAHPRISYFKEFWNWVELTIIACSWASFSMYLYRMYAIENLLDKIKNYTSDMNISLTMIKVSQLSAY
jgi:hypothetical protein